MKVGIDAHGGQLHEFIERPLPRLLNQTVDLELPGCQIDIGRAMRIQHRPLLGA
jgi:hypothetical protein